MLRKELFVIMLLHLYRSNRTCNFVHATVRQTKGGGGVDGICSTVFVDRTRRQMAPTPAYNTNASEYLYKGIWPFHEM